MNFNYQFIKYLVLMLSFLIISCETEKVIDYDTHYEGDKIVVHGYINQKDGVNVIVKKTVSPDDLEGDDVLHDANVLLIVNDDDNIVLSQIDNYLYTLPSSLLNMPNDYKIVVSSNTLLEVFSTTQNLFTAVAIDSLQIEEDGFHKNLKIFYNNLNLESRYYYKIFEYLDGEVVESSNYDDVMFNPYSIIRPLSTGIQQETYQVYTEELDSLIVKFYTFSNELSQFCESYSDYEGTSEDPFVDYRLSVFSNIENGYGLFTSYDYNQKTIVVN